MHSWAVGWCALLLNGAQLDSRVVHSAAEGCTAEW